MSVWDWSVSVALILLVVRQIRGRRLSVIGLLWPAVLVGWAGFTYLVQVPDHRSDWTFVVVLSVIGVLLGTGCGLMTSVYSRETVVMARASGTAAALWVIGMTSRLAFGIAVLHGGAAPISWLSERLSLHAISTWATALIVMALAEVLARTAVLAVKRRHVLLALT